MKALWSVGCLVMALVVVLAPAKGGDDGKKIKGDFEAFFKTLDADKDGKLNRDEFVKMADRAKDKKKLARQKLGEAYDKLDPEKKGIEKDLFKKYLDSRKD